VGGEGRDRFSTKVFLENKAGKTGQLWTRGGKKKNGNWKGGGFC